MERREFLKRANPFASTQNPSTASGFAALQSYGIQHELATLSNDLTAYSGPWTDVQIRHALRRATFGVPKRVLDQARALGSMEVLVDTLIDPARPMPNKPVAYVDELKILPRTAPQLDRINQDRQERARLQQLRNWWFDLMIKEDVSIREKLTLMWHNHFVTALTTVRRTALVYTYLDTLRRHSMGNVKELTNAITVDPAMLVYLNGNQSYYGKNPQGKNVGDQVNENYARELMELFTLGLLDPETGEANYTEEDIQNAAQALSGWQFTITAPYKGVLMPQSHNSGPKTFFGQTGNWGATDIVDMIFAKKNGYNAAYFISEKIYTTFVYYVPNKEVVRAMANLLIASNWDVAPVLKALFKSAHFYDEAVIGSQLKDAVGFTAGLIRDFDLKYPPFDPTDPPVARQNDQGQNVHRDTNPTLTYLTSVFAGLALGQELLDPPNVKGWPGGRNWISTGTYPQREQVAALALSYPPKLTGGGQARNINLQFAPLEWVQSVKGNATMTGQELSKLLEAHMLPIVLGPKETADLYDTLNPLRLPENDFYLKEEYVAQFATFAATLPEYQLH